VTEPLYYSSYWLYVLLLCFQKRPFADKYL